MARKTANVLSAPSMAFQAPISAAVSRKLNWFVWERPGRPNPSTPSNWNWLKGSSDISVAATMRMSMQPSPFCLACTLRAAVRTASSAGPGFGMGPFPVRASVTCFASAVSPPATAAAASSTVGSASASPGASVALARFNGFSLPTWRSEAPTAASASGCEATGLPRQTRSCMKTPVTSPVPNDTVIWSLICPGLTSDPSTSMS
mmetsp:Transcript_42494/g.74546  ORF Transcript_42494/g.74546 Transcript_42494/m.74546 type:complete len:204 (-) Transcript_42494:645-1256(-)